jgi:hypothetical protein
MPSRKHTRFVIGGVAAIAIAGGSCGIVSATSGSSSSTASTNVAAYFGSGSGSNARSGPEPGGTTGTVSSTSKSGFTVTTAGSVNVTVK